MKTRNIFTVVLMAVALLVASCEKDPTIPQDIQDLAEDDALVETVFDDVFNTADQAELLMGGALKTSIVITDSCPTVTIEVPDGAYWPRTITVDYGDTECTGFYEQTRKGKIIISLSGPRMTEGSVKTVTFDNYYINGIKVEGTKTITNTGYNESQNLTFDVSLTGGKLILEDESEITREFNKTYEWVVGAETRYFGMDDEYFITGSASGTHLSGVSFTRTIVSALHWKRVCKVLVAGVISVERSDMEEPFTLDYGDGTCDVTATITYMGESREINLRHRHRLQQSN